MCMPATATRERSPERAKRLQSIKQNHPESSLAVARAALDAGDYRLARDEAEAAIRMQPRESAWLLLADIEEADTGDVGKARQLLAKAVRAPRDPAWVADGFETDKWAPFSPVSGRLDAFEWRVPVERLGALIEEEKQPAVKVEAPVVLAAPPPAPVPADPMPEPVIEIAAPEPPAPQPQNARSWRRSSRQTTADNRRRLPRRLPMHRGRAMRPRRPKRPSRMRNGHRRCRTIRASTRPKWSSRAARFEAVLTGCTEMLERMISFLKELPRAGANSELRDDDPRIAASALLYHVMNVDGVRQDAEWDKIKQILGDTYDRGARTRRTGSRRRNRGGRGDRPLRLHQRPQSSSRRGRPHRLHPADVGSGLCRRRVARTGGQHAVARRRTARRDRRDRILARQEAARKVPDAKGTPSDE